MNLKLLSIIVVLLSFSIAKGQLGVNLDFESNTLSQWKFYFDTSSTANPSSITYNTNPISGVNTAYQSLWVKSNIKTLTGPVPKVLRPTSTNQVLDKYGLFPPVCNLPGGGKHSCKIGSDSFSSSVIQGMEYSLKIPPGMDRYNLVFFYATVLEDPGTSHQCWEMPFFNVNVYDSANPSVNFANLELTINRCNAPFVPNLKRAKLLVAGSQDTVYYSPWIPANMCIKNMGGKTVVIRATGSGCSPGFITYDSSKPSTYTSPGIPGVHFGYGYIDFDNSQSANYNNKTLYYCPSDSVFSLTPPPGYKGYIVYDSATNNVLAMDTNHPVSSVNSITLTGNKRPSMGSVVKVALVPYGWYGFADTLTYYIQSLNCNVGSPSLSIDKIDTTTCVTALNVAVRGNNLYTVSNLKGSIYWDTAYMNLGGIKFATNNINMNFNQIDVTNAANGYLIYNWSDSVSHYIADNSSLFTMVLFPKANVSGGTAVWFDSIPTKLKIDTAVGVAATNPSFNNGWIFLNDTPQIVFNVNVLICYTGCLPVHYQWNYNGVPSLYDTLEYIFPTGSGTYTCTVTYKNGHSVKSNTLYVVLPVTLKFFKAQGNKTFNTLSWQTVTEINTTHFNVQRSTNGKDFSTIGIVNAKGASEYTFNDQAPPPPKGGILYYRLEVVDNDGSKTYSEVRELSIINSPFSITPNPAKDFVTISGSNLKQITLVDFTGRTVITKEVNSNSIKLAISNLSKGIYMVKATLQDGSVKTEKLVVK